MVNYCLNILCVFLSRSILTDKFLFKKIKATLHQFLRILQVADTQISKFDNIISKIAIIVTVEHKNIVIDQSYRIFLANIIMYQTINSLQIILNINATLHKAFDTLNSSKNKYGYSGKSLLTINNQIILVVISLQDEITHIVIILFVNHSFHILP